MRRLRVGMIARAGGTCLDTNGFGRLPVKRQAPHQLPGCTVLIVPAGTAILPRPALDPAHRHPGLQRACKRSADEAGDIDPAKSLIGSVETGLQCAGRLADNIVDRAAGRTLPEQRALRTLEHFDPFDIEFESIGHHREIARNLVGIDRNCRRSAHGRIVQADSAQGVNRRCEGRLGGGKAGDQLAQIGNAINAAIIQRLGSRRLNGQADVIDRLLALVGRDDDFISVGGRALRFLACLRMSSRRYSQGGNRHTGPHDFP